MSGYCDSLYFAQTVAGLVEVHTGFCLVFLRMDNWFGGLQLEQSKKHSTSK